MENNKLLAKANQFFESYNTVNIKSLEELVSDDIHWEHHNRFKGQGKKGLMQSIRDFAKKAPGRYFSERTRWAINGEIVFTEHKWHAVPVAAVPSFGWTEGVPVTMDCCALLVFKDGKIIEYSDYA